MIDFDKILKNKGIKKQEVAKSLGIEPTNINRNFDRYNKNLSEIDSFLDIIGTSIKYEILGDKSKESIDSSLLTEKNDKINRLLSIIESQQRTIETLSNKLP